MGEPLADTDDDGVTLGDVLPLPLSVGVGLLDGLVDGGETLADEDREALLLVLADTDGDGAAVGLPLGLYEKE